ITDETPADSSTLSRVLEELEGRDLIRRRLEDRPIATYYDLTEKGESLASMFDDLEAWAVLDTVGSLCRLSLRG
ncbi:MAG: winged helix-turn-helix transcriptional regulator, partial [Halovenus sp.]